MEVIIIIAAYLLIINLIGFSIMGIDKAKARKRAWRISEATLFLTALCGGSLGTTLGMHFFHHKTLHRYFLYGMPAIMIVQIILALIIVFAPIQLMIL